MRSITNVNVKLWSHRAHDASVQRHDSDTTESLGKSWVIGDCCTTVAQHLQHRGTVVPSWVKVWHAQLCSTIICRVAVVWLSCDSRTMVSQQISYRGYQMNIHYVKQFRECCTTVARRSYDCRTTVARLYHEFYFWKKCRTTLHVRRTIVLR